MLLTKLIVSVGKKASRAGDQNIRVANDNPSHEQELFEQCVQRELGAMNQYIGEHINSDRNETSLAARLTSPNNRMGKSPTFNPVTLAIELLQER